LHFFDQLSKSHENPHAENTVARGLLKQFSQAILSMKIRVLNKARDQHAWSLAEVMVAVAVLAILLVSLFAGFAFGFDVIRSAREDLRATQIMMQKIEGLRLCTWSQLNSQCPFNFTESYSTTTGSTIVYQGTVSLTDNTNLPSAYQSKVKLVTVTVTWKTPRGDHAPPLVHTRTMQTESAYYGLQNYLYGLTNSI